ncbi:MAG: hypothetical protein WDN49_16360 [Acetobacteraceae bacterium]
MRSPPIYGVVSEPLATLRNAFADADGLMSVREENMRLREENERLRQWQAVAMALDAENTSLKANLHWIPDRRPAT